MRANKYHFSPAIAALMWALAAPEVHAGKELIDTAASHHQPPLAAPPTPRRAPGRAPPRRPKKEEIDPSLVPPPLPNLPREFIPVPDRWRLADSIGVVPNLWDPYNQNPLKADRPVFGEDWFVNLLAISDTVIEPRRFPQGRSPSGTSGAGAVDVFADADQAVGNQNLITSVSFIKGDTVFRPPDIELRLTPVFNGNWAQASEAGVLERDPRRGRVRFDWHAGIQEAFFDYHMRNVSDRFDFDSFRIGIQPFSTDFRGFLFQDAQLGFRLFGTRANNILQYNLAWFRRLEKDTNSGLNEITDPVRDDDIFIANLFVQDMPVLGFVSQFTTVYNRNREGNDFFFNENGFIERPASFGDERGHDYDVVYLGYNGDGHFGRANLTVSAYAAVGKDKHNQINSADPDNDDALIRAFFFAAEPSVDFDWIRVRGSFLYASGDSDPFDDVEEGFDAIFENPQFAGGDTSYWIRQSIPFVGGGGVNLTQRNGVLPSLASSKEHGQSNFNNPGLILVGVGTDLDVLPELRLSTNFNGMWFADTSNLEVLRNQGDIDRYIGADLSAAVIYRPFQSQNVVLRLSGAALLPGLGFDDLFAVSGSPSADETDIYYSILGNFILTF